MIPQTPGQVFWVAPAASYTVDGISYTASDSNDGLSPARALLTTAQAITNATASVGDVIVLLPGAHTGTSTITISKSGLTITGLPSSAPVNPLSRMPSSGKKQTTSITNTGTAGIIFTISAGVNDTEISHLTLLPTAAGGVGVYMVPAGSAAGANRTYIHDCVIRMVAAAATSTYGLQLGTLATGSNVDTVVRNCYFQSGDSTVSGANGAGVCVVGTAYGLEISSSTFACLGTAAWARAYEQIGAGASMGVFIRDCDFLNSAYATSLITTAVYTSGTVADGSLHVLRCYVSAGTDVATAAAIPDIVLGETYLMSAGGGALANNN